MPLQGTYEPSAWQPVADQVQTYEQTDGREGAELEGKPCVILWTRGRQSQKKGPRHCWRKPSQGAACALERKRDCYDEEKSQRFTVVNRRHATEQRISVEFTDFRGAGRALGAVLCASVSS